MMRLISLAFLLAFTGMAFIARAQIGAPFPGPGISGVCNTVLLFDCIRTTGIYSTRRLRNSYNGNALRVERSSNNNLADIGFVANDLDTTTMLTFVGANNGYVNIWYDQSGLGGPGQNKDLPSNNPTTTAQFQIVSSGALVSNINSKPSLFAPGSGSSSGADYRNNQGNLLSKVFPSGHWTVFAIAQFASLQDQSIAIPDNQVPSSSDAILRESGTVTTNWNALFLCGNTSGTPCGGTTAPKTVFLFVTGLDNGSVALTDYTAFVVNLSTTYVLVSKFDGSIITSYLNGGTGLTKSTSQSLDLTGGTQVGRGGRFFNGYVNELILMDGAQPSSIINTIGANMAARAGVTWTNVP
jgi:hypothetical protein